MSDKIIPPKAGFTSTFLNKLKAQDKPYEISDPGCKGLRIKTTIGKLKRQIESSFPEYKTYHGKVYYESKKSWNRTTNTENLLANSLFHKRIPYRYEAEYIHIIVVDQKPDDNRLILSIGNLYEFVDEILISPATSNTSWVSKTIYDISIRLSVRDSNTKNGNKFCRISQLYDQTSQTLGSH